MVKEKAVIIYDGNCFFCDFSTDILENLEWLKAIPLEDPESQEFLRAQFGEVPFSMFLIDREKNRIYAGEKAAKEISDRAGLPNIASDLIEGSYTQLSSIIGLASGRNNKVDDKNDIYKISDDAQKLLEKLFSAAGTPDQEI